MKTVQNGGRWLLGLVLGLLAVRLLSLGAYPLMDTTEARYGEIARKMVELGDWVTPWYDYGVPFWGKPPLSFWLTALSFKIFGVNEFAARLPHFLAGALVAGLLWQWAVKLGRATAVYSLALLIGAVLYLIATGAVMTDMSLAVGSTLAMRGFWLGLHGAPEERLRERWLLFMGLGIGLLAKGPLVLVIAGLPMAVWTLLNRQIGPVWRGLPWLRGTTLAFLLALPWYVLAERHTPGFLQYFLVGEHWHRFLTPGWKGDLYGHAHAYRYGTIWIMAVESCLPWALLLPLMAWRRRQQLRPTEALDPVLVRYLMLWGLMPCLFFTFAGNILPAYVLPGLPALALLGGYWLARLPASERVERWLAGGLVFSMVLMVAAPLIVSQTGRGERKSAKVLVQDYQHHRQQAEPLYVVSDNNIYSPTFYTRGQARMVRNVAELGAKLGPEPAFVALEPAMTKSLPPAIGQRLQPVARHGDFELYAVAPSSDLWVSGPAGK